MFVIGEVIVLRIGRVNQPPQETIPAVEFYRPEYVEHNLVDLGAANTFEAGCGKVYIGQQFINPARIPVSPKLWRE